MIGLDRSNWLVYEGVSNYGHGLWPTPIVARACIIEKDEDWQAIPKNLHLDDAKLVFREDSYDSVTGIRRGRLYEWQSCRQPDEWYVQQHPAIYEDIGKRSPQGLFRKELLTFRPVHGIAARVQTCSADVLLALGTLDALTVWTVVQVERVASGDEMVTLKTRSSLGGLPEVDYSKLPDGTGEILRKELQKLRNSMYREQASSIIEQSRQTAQVVLSHWFSHSSGKNVKDLDLGDLASCIEASSSGKDRKILLNTARTLGLFHNRNKPNVREKFGEFAREPNESDAAFSVQSISLLLHEVGWTRFAI